MSFLHMFVLGLGWNSLRVDVWLTTLVKNLATL